MTLAYELEKVRREMLAHDEMVEKVLAENRAMHQRFRYLNSAVRQEYYELSEPKIKLI